MPVFPASTTDASQFGTSKSRTAIGLGAEGKCLLAVLQGLKAGSTIIRDIPFRHAQDRAFLAWQRPFRSPKRCLVAAAGLVLACILQEEKQNGKIGSMGT